MAAAKAEGETPLAAPTPKAVPLNLTGIWRSEYSYYSTGRARNVTGVHYVVLEQQGGDLTVTSLAQASGSTMAMQLTVDGLAATGTWEERTSPSGYYKGAMYRGAIQLLLSPTGTQLSGRWLGFGKNFQINNGDWNLALETRSLSRRSRSSYASTL